MTTDERSIANFLMEVGLESAIPTRRTNFFNRPIERTT